MNSLWYLIEKQNLSAKAKYPLIQLILGSLFALIGFILWLFVRTRGFSSADWLICFLVYPMIVSWFLIFLYSCNHEFHDGKVDRGI